jgi:hypothetical protein
MAKEKVILIYQKKFSVKCSVCGLCFEDGFCGNGHEQGQSYLLFPHKNK